jgi:imidazoleglycerol-phosphate dehydratase
VKTDQSLVKTDQSQVSVRVELAEEGAATVVTGLGVLDYLVGELARTARAHLSLEVAPGAVDAEGAAAGRGLGEALAPLLQAPGAAGRGSAWLPADEALAGAVLEVSDRPLLASNVDFSGHRVGGLGSDVVAGFLRELAAGAGLNLHIRVLEGRDPQNVLRAIFKALGAALGQACRTPAGGAPR